MCDMCFVSCHVQMQQCITRWRTDSTACTIAQLSPLKYHSMLKVVI